jgi:excisionase family DNA binding protein
MLPVDNEYAVDDDVIDTIFGHEYLKPSDISQLFSISDSSVRKHIRDGNLKAIRVGGTYRIRKRDVVEFIAKNQHLYGAGE